MGTVGDKVPMPGRLYLTPNLEMDMSESFTDGETEAVREVKWFAQSHTHTHTPQAAGGRDPQKRIP